MEHFCKNGSKKWSTIRYGFFEEIIGGSTIWSTFCKVTPKSGGTLMIWPQKMEHLENIQRFREESYVLMHEWVVGTECVSGEGLGEKRYLISKNEK